MLNPAYQALLRIQSKISTTRTLEEIRSLMQEEASNPKVRVSPAAIWTLDLKALDQTVTSAKELGFRPILTKGEPQEDQPHLLKVEETNALGLFALQEAFIKIMQSAL
ncbi:MAG: hypothetical protein ACI8RA_001669 [Chlamydiales bacterium]|jgi:hypothetical protein